MVSTLNCRGFASRFIGAQLALVPSVFCHGVFFPNVQLALVPSVFLSWSVFSQMFVSHSSAVCTQRARRSIPDSDEES